MYSTRPDDGRSTGIGPAKGCQPQGAGAARPDRGRPAAFECMLPSGDVEVRPMPPRASYSSTQAACNSGLFRQLQPLSRPADRPFDRSRRPTGQGARPVSDQVGQWWKLRT